MRTATLPKIDTVRLEANKKLDPSRKAELGQFMTPTSVADFMASLFSTRAGDVRLLDAGAGVGSLTSAFLNKWGRDNVSVTTYEIDTVLRPYLRETLSRYGNGTFQWRIVESDFIEDAINRLQFGNDMPFTHAILNPPYKKINSLSPHRALLRAVGLETVNLYTAFVGLALALMSEGGELVAIIPRSFCNGPYYKPFREWLLERSSIERIHLFHSRTSAFTDDDVLQENIIIKLVRGRAQGDVTISTSSNISFSDLESHERPFAEIVTPGDPQRFIHVPTTAEHSGLDGVPLATHTLAELGIDLSTGPVVDFRLKDFLRAHPETGTVPLLYSNHFAGGQMEWPKESKKPNALVRNEQTEKWLYASGFYAVVRRFSSKEEKRRIVANVVEPEHLKAESIGFENHLNVFHSKRRGIRPNVARGLAVFLNSTAVDEYFRRFSGHTQVNATDLRLLKYPDLKTLEKLGQWGAQNPAATQEDIDTKIVGLHGEA